MKKLLSLLLSIIMLLCFTACNENDTDKTSSTKNSETYDTLFDTYPSVFVTENITSITFYAYYGKGKGSKVPKEHMDEIITWLDSFTIDKEVPELLPPGTNTINVEIEYFDGTIIKRGLDTATVDGITYYIKGDTAPECYEEIVSKTSLN
ncbi:MAG: hypothetical protein Q4A12_02000 [Eubacteriales bacterium]|nr:hypothetical protein [Eubacteriales bacterium]